MQRKQSGCSADPEGYEVYAQAVGGVPKVLEPVVTCIHNLPLTICIRDTLAPRCGRSWFIVYEPG